MRTTVTKRELPTDVLVSVFAFLTPQDLSRACARVCKQWRQVADCDILWSVACLELWKDKANVLLGFPFPNARYDASVDFSVRELKYLLMMRAVDTSRLIEKNEYRDALKRSDSKLKISYVPLRGKWKASFVYSLLDRFRDFITDKELCDMEWMFFFKSNPVEFNSKAKFSIDKSSGRTRFTMIPWPMEDVTEMPWRRNARGDVVIHHFPGHAAFRRSDWSFGLENEHVIFYQCNTPTFDADRVREELLELYS